MPLGALDPKWSLLFGPFVLWPGAGGVWVVSSMLFLFAAVLMALTDGLLAF